jgi:hypothetical protein
LTFIFYILYRIKNRPYREYLRFLKVKYSEAGPGQKLTTDETAEVLVRRYIPDRLYNAFMMTALFAIFFLTIGVYRMW